MTSVTITDSLSLAELTQLYHNRIWNPLTSLIDSNNSVDINKLRVLHMNVKSLLKSFSFYEALNLKNSCEVFAVSETWLKPNTPDTLVELEGFNIIREDRNDATKNRGGGAALYIKSNLKYSVLKHLSVSLAETCDSSVWVELPSKRSKPIIVGTVYLPPDSDKRKFLEELSNTLTAPNMLGKHVVLCGDFNVNWNSNSTTKTLFEHTMLSCGLRQHSTGVTFTSHLGHESLLDHNYVSVDLNVAQCKILTVAKHISDHYATYLVVHCPQTVRQPRKIIQTRSYRKFDSTRFHIDFSQLPTLQLVKDYTKSIHERTLLLESSITDLLNLHLPVKKLRVRGQGKPWLTKDLLHLISLKNRFYKKVFQSNLIVSDSQIKHYHKFKNFVINRIRTTKKDYYSNKASESSSSFFKCLATFTGKNKSATQIDNLAFEGEIANTEIQIADMLNQYFTNIPGLEKLSSRVDSTAYSTHSHQKLFQFEHVPAETVFNQILSLSATKRGGLSEIPGIVYHSIADLLAPAVSVLINESLDTSTFPDCLKIALVTPLFKKGDQSSPSNYRPISSLPILSKLFEMNIKNQLLRFIENKNLLSSRQFGFRQHHSSEQLIQSLLQKWYTDLDKKQPVYISALSLDVRKAFDSINHKLLVSKLPRFLLSNNVILLIDSYLSNRYQAMKVGSSRSATLPITCGVPQGSILGPVLFLLAINDLLCLFPTAYAYADDTLIYTIGQTVQQSVHSCSQLLHSVNKWYGENLLQLNFSKTQYCIFTNREVPEKQTMVIDNAPIHSTNTLSLLGVTLDSGLTFKQHVDNLSSKANSLIHLTSKFKKVLNIEQSVKVYTSIIRPILEYCSSILLNVTLKLSNMLERTQNRAIRIILSAPRKFSVTTGRLLVNLHTLKSRREYLFSRFVQTKLLKSKASKSLRELVSSQTSHKLSLRSKHNMVKPYSRTRFSQSSFCNTLHIFLSAHYQNPRKLLSFETA